jgi:UDP-N-acetylmuramate: L-alanyl-gamma-D-glutamyl-meso-diaminopimelate ligase
LFDVHVHILGICGTFMGGIALIARELGHSVTGSDANVYPPMSTQLEAAGIALTEGYDPSQLDPQPDVVVVGNAMSRGNPCVEAILDKGLPYTSGPQWLAEHVLADRWVLAVAGTHGKTTTSSMLAWILEYANLKPGFLIGGVPANFGLSARAGDAPFFVVEADEYDTAFFDKRSKFVHYHPRTAVLNNMEFDHADIFDSLADIQRQFHHLVRTIPSSGLIVSPKHDQAIIQTLEKGCWTPVETLGQVDGDQGDWSTANENLDGTAFDVLFKGESQGHLSWALSGEHNVSNALAAIAAARHAGVPADVSIDALAKFENVKRRMELRGTEKGVRVFDDFAHHPTAIDKTLRGLRAQVGSQKIIAVLEPRSNTMRMGVLADRLVDSLAAADEVLIYAPSTLNWDAEGVLSGLGDKLTVALETQAIVDRIAQTATADQHVLVMSNGGFENIHQRILDALAES